jgi:hypothetical protein
MCGDMTCFYECDQLFTFCFSWIWFFIHVLPSMWPVICFHVPLRVCLYGCVWLFICVFLLACSVICVFTWILLVIFGFPWIWHLSFSTYVRRYLCVTMDMSLFIFFMDRLCFVINIFPCMSPDINVIPCIRLFIKPIYLIHHSKSLSYWKHYNIYSWKSVIK